MKYHMHLFIALFTFCNLLGGDFPEQPETSLSPTEAKEKARYEKTKLKREKNPKLDAQYRAQLKAAKAKQRREKDPELQAQYRAQRKAQYEKTKLKREKDPELQAQYKAQRKATRAKAKQEREERLKATTPSEELYSFIPLQSPAEEKPPIKSLEEIEEEWIKKQVDDLFNSSPKPELYPSWDDMFSDEEKEELSRRF